MSTVINLLSTIHQRQLATVQKGQETVLGVLGRTAQVLDKTPRPPERVQTGLTTITSRAGSPSDYVRYAVSSSKDWAHAREVFQDGVLGLFSPAPTSSPSTSSSHRSSKRGRSAKA